VQSFARNCKRSLVIAVLLTLALALALPLSASADGAREEGVFASIRVYDGIDTQTSTEDLIQNVNEFLEIISQHEGFIAYYWLRAGDRVAAINLFATAEQAAASSEAAIAHVAATAAHLAPNPPRVIEGVVDIAFVEVLDGMGADDVNGLHASVRIYDGFQTSDMAEFVGIVEDGFLPIMRESDGFFGYYLMNDSAGALVAISIFDTEASALASNEKASDFVAENLTAYLPNAPMITSGPLQIAVLAAVNDGANLIEAMPGAASAFASVRLYDGVDPADQVEIARLVDEGFLPIMRGSDGFIGYFLLPAGDMLAAVSLFDSAEQAAASTHAARDFVAEYLTPYLPNPPQILEGKVEILRIADAEMMMDGSTGSLYASLRLYSNFDLAHLDQTVEVTESVFLPLQQGAAGFFAYMGMHDNVDRTAALSIFSSEDHALAANELAADVVAEHLAQWLPDDPVRINGRLGVAALADVHMGENLIQNVDDGGAFASVRVYDGVDPADQPEIVRRVNDGFLPIMRESDGFVGYYLLPAGDMLAAITLFETADQASASTEAARDFVSQALAPLLPNAPMVVEGTVEVSTQLMFSPVDPDDLSLPLHARLAIYDGFDMARLDETVELLESVLLPDLRDIGVFSYHGISDGVDKAVALRIMGSEESLHQGSDIAADFVAEYLAGWLPEDPLVLDGRLGVASVQGILQGLNLADYFGGEDSAFASVRVYDGVDPADQAEIARLVDEGFLPIMRESDGFIAYFLLPAGDMLATVSAFETADQAAASNDAARSFVAENLTPLLPNPPLIAQGPMDTGYFTLLDEMMMPADATSLYASLRLYDQVDLTQRAESTELVHRIFLPTLQEAEGFWGYVRLHDGVQHSIALSIYDSEANALAANDLAAAFVADYLSDRPQDQTPLRINGQLGVAALAGANEGANLIQAEKTSDRVFASVRVYDGVVPSNMDEIVSRTDAGFLPIIRQSDGFVGYYFLTAGDMLATVSLFDSPEQASASNDAARDFIVENLAPLLPNPPLIYEGHLSINQVSALGASTDLAGAFELYASIRLYEGFDLSHFEEANDLAIARLLPALAELDGFFALFALNDGKDTVVGISMFDNEAASLTANDLGKAFTQEYLADWAPNPPTGVEGKIAIASHAAIHQGDNLVGATMQG